MTSRTRVRHGTSPLPREAERRGDSRNGCEGTALCRPITGPPNVTWRAGIWDASVGGIGLTTTVPFEPGTVLAVDLDLGENKLTKLVVVRHVRPQSGGNWAVGGFFVHPLSRQQMDALR